MLLGACSSATASASAASRVIGAIGASVRSPVRQANADRSRADLPGAGFRPGWAGFQPRRSGEEIFSHFGAIDLSEKPQAFFVISGIAAYGRQPIGRKCHEVGNRQPSRHIFYIWIKAAVFVDNQDPGQFSCSIARESHRCRRLRP